MHLDNNIIEQILTGFIKNEIHKIGLKKAVIGLSGGIDSAVSAFLAAKALGSENVTCVMMPHKISSKESVTHAKLVIEKLNVHSKLIDITAMTDGYLSTAGKDISKVRIGNVMARARMIALYDISAEENALVVGTSNKTEILLGYTTIYGDSASAINPLGDLYKTQLRELAAYMGMPEEIMNKKPSADLWAGQTDEDELGFTYEKVDRYLFAKVDERRTDEELEKMGFEKSFIEKVNTRVMRNQFRRLPPVIAKLQNRTVNIDFRYNRDWGV
jgi:NAD+ synthase